MQRFWFYFIWFGLLLIGLHKVVVAFGHVANPWSEICCFFSCNILRNLSRRLFLHFLRNWSPNFFWRKQRFPLRKNRQRPLAHARSFINNVILPFSQQRNHRVSKLFPRFIRYHVIKSIWYHLFGKSWQLYDLFLTYLYRKFLNQIFDYAHVNQGLLFYVWGHGKFSINYQNLIRFNAFNQKL